MEYRTLPHGGEQLSILGLGSSFRDQADARELRATAEAAVEAGINFFDLAAAEAAPFAAYGDVLSACRSKVYYQIHFGAEYTTGKYGWTTDLNAMKRSVDWQLKELKTDYIDFGFLHCLDEEADLQAVLDGGVLDHIQSLQKAGVVRHIALSSHTPRIVNRVLDLGVVDLVMFSINPGYDCQHGEFAFGAAGERMDLYRRCAAGGVGISVMKPFSGGQLLDAKTSPFGKALTEYQCLQYALDKPGVLTVLPGVRNRHDLRRILGFLDAPPEERDYSILGTFTPRDVAGTCVYCNHCQPCPAGLDVGLINKYYDLTKAGDDQARVHYETLEKHAGDCIRCGHCEDRCPFHVAQMARMEEIQSYFGL